MGDEKPNSEEFYHEFLKKYDTISSPTELIKSKIFNTMRVITDVHSYKTANLIINYFVFTIQTIQLFCITMFPGDYGIWSIDSEFSRVGTIFSIFLRKRVICTSILLGLCPAPKISANFSREKT